MAHSREPWRVGNLASYDAYTGQPFRNIWAGDDDDPSEPLAVVVARAIDNGDVDANAARIVACVNVCAGLTDDQVAAIPRLVAWFTQPASADYLDFVVPEYHHLCKVFPRREATS